MRAIVSVLLKFGHYHQVDIQRKRFLALEVDFVVRNLHLPDVFHFLDLLQVYRHHTNFVAEKRVPIKNRDYFNLRLASALELVYQLLVRILG